MEFTLRLIALALGGYLAVCGVLYLIQDRLIFLPRALLSQPKGPHVQPASVDRGDVTLRGWIVNPGASGPLVVYFGGNAEELSTLVDVFRPLEATTALINYRGYGESGGSPSADALLADARSVVREMQRRWGEQRRLVLFGRSLGTGIAMQAVTAAEVDAVILMSPYRTLTDVARRQMPWVPVDTLLRHRIDATAGLDSAPARALVLYGSHDRIIPTAESRAFVDLLEPPPLVVTFDAGHNVPLTYPEIWRPVRRFIEGRAPAR